jgi:ribosomal protein S18 acetylase RimI-like enzyme
MTGLEPTIRAYRSDDGPAVVRILAESEPWKTLGYHAADWQPLFAPLPDGREGYVLETEGAVAGIALVKPRVLLGDYLELLVVAPAARGRGLGGALLRHAEQVVFARARNLFVCVSDFNEGARRFYARHGYEVVGPIPDLLVRGKAEILMRKTIGPARGK